MHTFDPEEQYDPYRPNDLGEYQEYRKRVREERREKYMENKRRRAAGESSEGSSDYSDSEEDVAPRRDGESSHISQFLRTVLSQSAEIMGTAKRVQRIGIGDTSSFGASPSAFSCSVWR